VGGDEEEEVIATSEAKKDGQFDFKQNVILLLYIERSQGIIQLSSYTYLAGLK